MYGFKGVGGGGGCIAIEGLSRATKNIFGLLTKGNLKKISEV